MLEGGLAMGLHIGLILASIHTGLAVHTWKAFADLADERGDTLFIFPGGRLSCPDGYEYLRSLVYPLVNRQNVQAAVSWGSSLGGFVPLEAVEAFHRRLDVPFAVYGLRVPGHPYLGFDSFEGMRLVVRHCIEVHGCRRIAFLRGPKDHPGAQDRYRGYLRALEEAGIPVDEKLVSGPHAWHAGEAALAELTDERGLRPGSDFDTLVCASDMMLLAAGKVLETRGVAVPRDLRLVGFNDTEESLLLSVPCTTVRMPVDAVCAQSYRAACLLAEGKPEETGDLVLPMRLVVRASCGCANPLGSDEEARALFAKDAGAFAAWVRRALPAIDPAAFEGDLAASLGPYLRAGGDPLLVQAAIHLHALAGGRDDSAALLDQLVAQETLAAGEEAYARRIRRVRLDALKNGLLCTRRLSDICPLCRAHLPALGIPGMYLVLQDGGTSRFIGGFEGDVPVETAETEFPQDLILPHAIQDRLPHGIYLVEPLFMENQPLGYAVLRVTMRLSALIETVRMSLSSAVKGALLLESANRAKEQAEWAERQTAAYIAALRKHLARPLREAYAASDGARKEKLGKAMQWLEFPPGTAQEERDFVLKPPRKGLPPVFLDPTVCRRIRSALAAAGGTAAAWVAGRDGLRYRVSRSPDHPWSPQGDAMQAVRRLAVLLGGTLEADGGGASLLVPWPLLAAEGPFPYQKRAGAVYALGAGREGLVAGARPVDARTLREDPSMLDGCSLLVGDVRSWGPDELDAVRFLAHDRRGRSLPVAFFGLEGGCASILSELDRRTSGERQVLAVCGTLPPGLERLVDVHEVRGFGDLATFRSLVRRCRPACCIMDRIDAALVRGMREVSEAPVVVLADSFALEEIEAVAAVPGVVVAHACIARSDGFVARLRDIAAGGGMLSPLTGVLVKRAVAYLDAHAASVFGRWQVAEAVNVSEDYLSRVFSRELGLSPWDYLIRLRIDRAVKLLSRTALSVGEVARASGFQDQAYFCRVFKKYTGMNPGKVRRR